MFLDFDVHRRHQHPPVSVDRLTVALVGVAARLLDQASHLLPVVADSGQHHPVVVVAAWLVADLAVAVIRDARRRPPSP